MELFTCHFSTMYNSVFLFLCFPHANNKMANAMNMNLLNHRNWVDILFPGLIIGLRPANERRRYFVTMSLIGWVQA